MAEWDSVSQHVHDKGELNLGRNDRDECYVHAYICKYIIYMYVTYIYTHTHMYLFNCAFQYFVTTVIPVFSSLQTPIWNSYFSL